MKSLTKAALIALLTAYALWRSSLPEPLIGPGRIELALLIVSAVLLAGSRSALSRYYRRAGDLLADRGPNHKETTMTNGGGQHHDEKSKKPAKTEDPKAKAGTVAKPEKTGK